MRLATYNSTLASARRFLLYLPLLRGGVTSRPAGRRQAAERYHQFLRTTVLKIFIGLTIISCADKKNADTETIKKPYLDKIEIRPLDMHSDSSTKRVFADNSLEIIGISSLYCNDDTASIKISNDTLFIRFLAKDTANDPCITVSKYFLKINNLNSEPKVIQYADKNLTDIFKDFLPKGQM